MTCIFMTLCLALLPHDCLIRKGHEMCRCTGVDSVCILRIRQAKWGHSICVNETWSSFTSSSLYRTALSEINKYAMRALRAEQDNQHWQIHILIDTVCFPFWIQVLFYYLVQIILKKKSWSKRNISMSGNQNSVTKP